MLRTRLTKFFQWEWIDVKILRRQTLDNIEKLYTLHKSFKPLSFLSLKNTSFSLLIRRFFRVFFFSSCHQTWFRKLQRDKTKRKTTKITHKCFLVECLTMSLCKILLMLSTTDAARSHIICFCRIQTKITQFFVQFFLHRVRRLLLFVLHFRCFLTRQNDIICKSQKNYFQFQRNRSHIHTKKRKSMSFEDVKDKKGMK